MPKTCPDVLGEVFFMGKIRSPPFHEMRLIKISMRREEKSMKNDYIRNYFVVKKDSKGVKHFYFNVSNQLVEVSKDVYLVCFGSYMKMRRDINKDISANLVSYDYINNDGHTLLDVIGKNVDYEKEVLISQVLDEIKYLNQDEQMLVNGLYIDGNTLRDMSEKTGIPVMTLQYKKKKILKKLKNKIY